MRIPPLRRWTAVLFSVATMLVAISICLPVPAAKAAPTVDDLVVTINPADFNDLGELWFHGTIQNIKIIWETGVTQTLTNQVNGGPVSAQYSFPAPTPYDVIITKADPSLPATLSGFGSRLADGSCSSPLNAGNLTSIVQWGNLGLTSLDCMGYGRTGLTNVPTTLPSGITSLVSAFEDARSFDQNISGWNVASVTSMRKMFTNAHAYNNGGVAITWTTTSLTDTSQMFQNAFTFNRPIGSWNMSNVTNMDGMFNVATSFNQDISSWDVSSLTAMNGMFEFAYAFNQNLSNWSTGNVTSMNSTFRGARAFTNGGQALTWNTGNVTDMGLMFSLAENFNQDISSWNTSKVVSFVGMFSGAQVFNQDITGWDTSDATDINSMFENATAFNYSLANWDIRAVSNMLNMFSGTAGISDTNYSSTLIGWASQPVQTNVRLDASAQAITCPAIAARDTLRSAPNSWTINDIAPTLNCSPDNGGSNELARTGQDPTGLMLSALVLLLLGGLITARAWSRQN